MVLPCSFIRGTFAFGFRCCKMEEIKVNKYQTKVTEEALSSLPQELQDAFKEFIFSVPDCFQYPAFIQGNGTSVGDGSALRNHVQYGFSRVFRCVAVDCLYVAPVEFLNHRFAKMAIVFLSG